MIACIQMILKNFLICWNFEFNLKSCYVRTYLDLLFMFECFEVYIICYLEQGWTQVEA